MLASIDTNTDGVVSDLEVLDILTNASSRGIDLTNELVLYTLNKNDRFPEITRFLTEVGINQGHVTDTGIMNTVL